MKKIVAVILLLVAMVLLLTACNQADRVSQNISKEADNFNVTRRLVAINTRTDSLLFEVIGNFSMSNNSSGELEITMQTGPNEYKKHFIYINKTWTSYTVEDISGSNVSPYHYEINFLPEMIVPIAFTSSY